MLRLLRRPNIVLLACQPKAASTFIANVLGALPDSRQVRLVPGYDRREQELSEARILRYRFRGTSNLVAQAHVRRSAPTDGLVEKYGIKVVVLTRNPFDTVVSMRDHIRRESARFPFAHFTEVHRQMADEDLDMAIVRFILPWIVSFRQSWRGHPTAQFLDYSEFQRDKTGSLLSVSQRAGMAADANDIKRAFGAAARLPSRLNVGESGRGRLLSPRVAEAIADLARAYKAGESDPELGDFLHPPDGSLD